MFAWFSTTIRDEIWDCCASPVIAFSSMPKKSNRSSKMKTANSSRERSPAFWSPASETFFWATMPLAWKSRAAWRAASFPTSVRVADFGIRGFDLAYALQDGYETTILVDACPHGEAARHALRHRAGSESLDGPEAAGDGGSARHESDERAAHGQAMNIELKRVLLVGCEPETLGREEGQMGLSAPVEAAVDEAVKLVESLVDRILKRG